MGIFTSDSKDVNQFLDKENVNIGSIVNNFLNENINQGDRKSNIIGILKKLGYNMMK